MPTPERLRASPEADPNDLALACDFTQKFAKLLTDTHSGDLSSRLTQFAQLIVQRMQFCGAFVVALDHEDRPVGVGRISMGSPDDFENLQLALRLQGRITSKSRDTDTWIYEKPNDLNCPQAISAMMRPIRTSHRCCGILAAAVSENLEQSFPVLKVLEDLTALLACGIEAAIKEQIYSYCEALCDLAALEFCGSEADRSALHTLLDGLAKVTRADSVSLFLREQEEIRLSACTSKRPFQTSLAQIPGPEVEWVFKTGEVLRLDTIGVSEVALQDLTFVTSSRPNKAEDSMPLLAVPLRYKRKTIGVLRFARRATPWPFSAAERGVLQSFADSLGMSLVSSWESLLYRHICNTHSEAICVSRRAVSDDGRSTPRIVLANPGAEKLFGRTQAEFVNLDARDLYAPGAYEVIHDELERAIHDGRLEHGPVPSQAKVTGPEQKDCTTRLVEISYRLLRNWLFEAPTFYTVGVIRDTTESQRLAKQHKRILQMLGEKGLAYFRVDLAGSTVESSLAETAITGYSQEELAAGLVRESLYVDPSQRGKLLDQVRKADGRLVRTTQHLRRKNGKAFWAAGDMRLLKDTSGRPTGYEGLYQDVTERIALQGFVEANTDTVLREQVLFERLQEAVSFNLQYMVSLSHQLQTPLSSIIENLRNLEQGVIPPDRFTVRLEYLIGQCLVCTALVQNLSYMDKILTGEPFKTEKVSLAKLAIETKVDFVHLLKEKTLSMDIDSDSLNQHLVVVGHRQLLRQVLVNLVDNAIKYSVPRSKIRISGGYWPRGRMLEITNRGLRVPKEEREAIFKRGYRSEKAKSLVPYGTGFGLWLVQKILKMHRATIWCHEVKERNLRLTSFRILFPHPEVDLRRP